MDCVRFDRINNHAPTAGWLSIGYVVTARGLHGKPWADVTHTPVRWGYDRTAAVHRPSNM